MHLKKYIWILCPIKIWSITTNVLFTQDYVNQVEKIEIKNNSQINYSDEDVVKQYHNETYKQIFKDMNNPGENVKDQKNWVNYYWKGTWATPIWGKLKYKFSAGYAYLINKMIMEPEQFVDEIKQWIKNNELSDKLKVKILKDLFVNYININNHENTREFFTGYISSTDMAARKIENYLIIKKQNHQYRQRDEQMTEILRGSLINIIKKMEKDKNSSWVSSYIYESYTKEGSDKPYDGGLNFFIYYNSKNYQKFLDHLLRGRSNECKTSLDIDERYSCSHEFASERTSGGKNYLSFLNWNSWIYYFPEEK